MQWPVKLWCAVPSIFVLGSLAALANNPPTITLNTNEVVLRAGASAEILFTVTDPDSVVTRDGVQVFSMNPALVPNSTNHLWLGMATNGMFLLTVTALPEHWGTAELLLVAGDGENTVTNSMLLRVRSDGSYSPVPLYRPTDELQGWWRADNDALDTLGRHHGALLNGARFASGTLGQAFELDGVDDYVEIAGGPESGASEFSIDIWIYPVSCADGKTIVVSKGGSFPKPKFELSLVKEPAGAPVMCVAVDATTNFMTLTGRAPIALQKWTHVVVNLGYAGLAICVDGQPDVSLAGPLWLYGRSEEPWWLGKGEGGLAFHGCLDEFAWYRHALSMDEIRTIYELGKSGLGRPPQILSQPQSLSAGLGSVAELALAAASAGGLPLFYQWQFNGSDIAGATNASLQLRDLRLEQSGAYSVRVWNEAGSATSSTATLAVAGLIAWGRQNWSGELNVPKELMNITAIAVGGERNLVLRSDGTLFAWGSRIEGTLEVRLGVTNLLSMSTDGDQETLLVFPNREVFRLDTTGHLSPTGMTNVISVSVNGNRRMALRADGTVLAWGSSLWRPESFEVEDLTNAVAVAAGPNHCLALRADGTVVGYGASIQDGYIYGQTNVPVGLSNVVAIAASHFHNLALKADGTIVSWGGYWDDPAYNGWNSWMTNTPPEATNVVAIAAGQVCNLALRADGRVVEWGSPNWGWIDGSPDYPNVVAIGAGGFHALALLRDGTPQLTVEPWDLTVNAGAESTFVSKAVGKQSMGYQWEFNGNPIPGATNQTYKIRETRVADQGLYSLTVSNRVGIAASRKARLKVNGSPVPLVQLTALGVNGNQFSFLVDAPLNVSPVIQRSFDLKNWSNLYTSGPVAGPWKFLDQTSAPPTNGFYRVWIMR